MPGSLPLPLDLPDPTAIADGELAKSRRTRIRILNAARDLLAEQGYGRFSTPAVARRAGLTRPAMLYHFPSRLDLVTAVIQYLVRRRIEMFEAAMAALPRTPSHKGQAVRAAAVELSWRQLETPEFAAFTELVMAARTDRELAAILRPALATFDRTRRETTERVLPPGSYDPDDLQLVRDVVRFLTEGVVQQNSLVEDRETRLSALRHFLHMLAATTAGNQFLEAVVLDWKARQRG